MEKQQQNTRKILIGSAFIVLGAIGFSSKSIFIKLAYADQAQIDAITLMTLRMMLSLPFFLVVALWKHDSATQTHTRQDWLALIVLGFMGYYLASLLDFSGLVYLSAGLERLILFLYPTFVVLLTALLYRKPVSKTQRNALLLSYLGILLVFGSNPQASSPDLLLGALLVFASAVVFALFMTGSGHYIPRFGASRFTAYSMSIACLATGIHFVAIKPISELIVPDKIFGLAMLLALCSTVIPSFLMSAGIHRIGASQAAIVSAIGPISTLALAYVFLHETLGPLQIIGTTMVLGGVLLVSLKKESGK